MKIALYYPWINLKSGIEKTIVETIKGSKHHYTIFTNQLDQKNTFAEFNKFDIVKLKSIPNRDGIKSIIQSAFIIATQQIDLAHYDLLVVHSEGISDLIMLKNKSIPTICYCHTPHRQVFDKYHQKLLLKGSSLYRKVLLFGLSSVFKTLERYIWAKYKFIIFNSYTSLNRALRSSLISSKKKNWTIIHPGANWEEIEVTKKFQSFFLLPGRISESKNIELAIKAFLAFEKKSKKTNFRLIISGQLDSKDVHYFNKLKNLAKPSKKIIFIINPSKDQIDRLYSNCYLALATALNEDWGLTAIEANAYGKPVLSVKSGGYKESQIDGKTGYLLTNDPDKFAKKMLVLSQNEALNRKLGKFARNNSKKYSWNNFTVKLDSTIAKLRRS